MPFLDNARVEETSPQLIVPVPSPHRSQEVSETSENQLSSSAHIATPSLKTTAFTATVFLQNALFFLWLFSVRLWLEMLRMVEERHVYVLYLSPTLDSEPLLYVKAMSLLSVSGSLGSRSLPSP